MAEEIDGAQPFARVGSKCRFCLKMWDEKSTAAVAHTMPKDLQDSSHQEEYDIFLGSGIPT